MRRVLGHASEDGKPGTFRRSEMVEPFAEFIEQTLREYETSGGHLEDLYGGGGLAGPDLSRDLGQRRAIAKQIETLGLAYQLVSSQTSLIVLETDADERRMLDPPAVDTALSG